MNSPRYWQIATALEDGRVLIAGGVNAGTSAELYDPVQNTFAVTGSMTVARNDFAAVRLLDGRVLLIGGGQGGAGASSAEIYDPVKAVSIPHPA